MKRAIAVLALSLVACFGDARPRTASQGSPTKATLDEVPIRGWYVKLVMDDRDDIHGELLAVDETYFYVEGRSNPEEEVRVHRIPQTWVDHIDLTTGDGSGATTGLAVLGLLTTPTHGWFLVASTPIWLITVGAVAPTESARETLRFRPPFRLIGTYARFPQGPPPHLAPQRAPERAAPPPPPSTPPPPSIAEDAGLADDGG